MGMEVGHAVAWPFSISDIRERLVAHGISHEKSRNSGIRYGIVEQRAVGWVEPQARPTRMPRLARWASLSLDPPYGCNRRAR